MRTSHQLWVLLLLVGVAALAACGGPISTTPVAHPQATFSPVPLATFAPFDVMSDAIDVPVPASTSAAAAPVTLPLPSTAQIVNELDLSADGLSIPAGTLVDEEATNETPSDVPAPTSARRVVQTKGAKIHIETVAVTFSNKIVLKSRPTFVFSFAAGYLIAANYYVQMYDSSNPGLGWQDPFEGPATLSGSSLLFVDATHKFTFEANVKYRFDLYAVSAGSSPTPIPAPSDTSPAATPAPTATPSASFGFLTVTPPQLAFTQGGEAATISVAESGYSGSFTASVSDPTLATIAQNTATSFQVVATNNPGAGEIIVKDGTGQTVHVPFTVTITTGTISSRDRHAGAAR